MPVVVGLLLSGGLVWQASDSAFTVTTSNSGNSVEAATLNLTHDSTGPLFSTKKAAPGATGSHCIQISSSIPMPSAVKLHVDVGTAPVNDISTYVVIEIEKGTGGTYASCAKFTGAEIFDDTLSVLAGRHQNYGDGLGPWELTGTTTETMSFRVTWTFASTAPDSTQGGATPPVKFTWEARA
jgi:hypothetical protein